MLLNMYNHELPYILFSFLAGVGVGLIGKAKAVRKEKKGRLWAEQRMVDAHKKILELEKQNL